MSATILASTSQPAGGSTTSSATAFALDTVVQCECQNPAGGGLASPCLASLLLSNDGGLTYVPVKTKRFELTAPSAFETFVLAEWADFKVPAATSWYYASGVAAPVGQLRTFKPPWDHFMVLFSGNLGASVTVSAIGDSGALSAGAPPAAVVPSGTSGTINLDLSAGAVFEPAALTGSTTFNLLNATYRPAFTLAMIPAGQGITFGFSPLWPGGTTPTWTSTSGKVDTVVFVYRSAASQWYGYVAGQNS